jgi:hypothetical protein
MAGSQKMPAARSASTIAAVLASASPASPMTTARDA